MKIYYVSEKVFNKIETYIRDKLLVDLHPGPKVALWINNKVYVKKEDKYVRIRVDSSKA